jgi:hypothetical protein
MSLFLLRKLFVSRLLRYVVSSMVLKEDLWEELQSKLIALSILQMALMDMDGVGGVGGGGEIVVIEATTDGEKGTLTMTVTAVRLGLMGSMPTKESNTISRLMLSLNHSRRIVLALVVLKLKSMLSINVCTRKNGMFSLW